ncbi:DUF4180 domain-containing protein [Arenibacter sp. BSSL-BM3]|uniref:DUF4180 domain-containing protein n=1 Tax=Arenibacter arenosicollis TaxID=2762274 RepID=A0ABR7QR07_9FLAO|nr:DUF4180 domain-containing protein [Arenibacter arenosicollis]MBC8769601.1 DUF4180 domain-containing protein [Arenibacter arenosicollis]
MEIKEHLVSGIKIAEVISNEIIIENTETALDILGNLYYQGFDKIIIHEKNITPAFFDLKTKIAGDILQKFSQYRMPLFIVGCFSKYESKSLKDFIYESNKGTHVNFASNFSEAIKFSSK